MMQECEKLNFITSDSLLSLPPIEEFMLFYYNFGKILHVINLGDYIQTLAVQKAISSIFKKVQFTYWDRDNLRNYIPKNKKQYSRICVMQGFFPACFECIPNNYVSPIIIGLHLGANFELENGIIKLDYNNSLSNCELLWKDLIKRFPDYFSNLSIACRDKRNMEFFKALGIDSYFSRCLTLTLPKRDEQPTQDKVFISCRDYILEYLPNSIKQDAIIFCPEIPAYPYLHREIFPYYSIPKIFDLANEQLENLKNNAKLIITDRIHVAAPSIAMGIPTILLKINNDDARYGVFDGIIKTYNVDDLKNNKVDFTSIPAPIDIEDLKTLMLKNLELSIKLVLGKSKIKSSELKELRSKIENYNIL